MTDDDLMIDDDSSGRLSVQAPACAIQPPTWEALDTGLDAAFGDLVGTCPGRSSTCCGDGDEPTVRAAPARAPPAPWHEPCRHVPCRHEPLASASSATQTAETPRARAILRGRPPPASPPASPPVGEVASQGRDLPELTKLTRLARPAGGLGAEAMAVGEAMVALGVAEAPRASAAVAIALGELGEGEGGAAERVWRAPRDLEAAAASVPCTLYSVPCTLYPVRDLEAAAAAPVGEE